MKKTEFEKKAADLQVYVHRAKDALALRKQKKNAEHEKSINQRDKVIANEVQSDTITTYIFATTHACFF